MNCSGLAVQDRTLRLLVCARRKVEDLGFAGLGYGSSFLGFMAPVSG